MKYCPINRHADGKRFIGIAQDKDGGKHVFCPAEQEGVQTQGPQTRGGDGQEDLVQYLQSAGAINQCRFFQLAWYGGEKASAVATR